MSSTAADAPEAGPSFMRLANAFLAANPRTTPSGIGDVRTFAAWLDDPAFTPEHRGSRQALDLLVPGEAAR